MGHKFLSGQFWFQVSAKEKLKKGISEKLKRVKSFLILLTILLAEAHNDRLYKAHTFVLPKSFWYTDVEGSFVLVFVKGIAALEY